jgi:hypothetical protein
MVGFKKNIVATVCLCMLLFRVAHGQELEPRSYSNTPVGLNFLIAGYSWSEGGLSTDPALPLDGADLEISSLMLAYVRSIDFWGRAGKIDVVLPYVDLSGRAQVNGESRERNVDGLGDPRVRVGVLLYGAPALSLQEFASYRPDLVVGASLQVTAPGDQYDPDRAINIGTNRWSIKPEFGFSKRFGAFTLELAGAVAFYTENTDYFGGRRLEQRPLSSVQGHVIYQFSNGAWIALDGTYYWGGRLVIEGERGDDWIENSRAGVTLSLPVNRHNSIKLYTSSGVSTRTGTEFNTVGVAWQYRWGGGL